MGGGGGVGGGVGIGVNCLSLIKNSSSKMCLASNHGSQLENLVQHTVGYEGKL